MSIDPTKYADPNYFKVSLKTPMAIAIAGGADSGKKAFCEALTSRLNKYATKVALLSLTQFYRELTPKERIKYEAGEFYSDHPDAFDMELLKETVRSILAGKSTTVPEWDASSHTRKGTRVMEPVDVLLIEGTLLLYDKELSDLMFMKVFIDEDSDERLARRVRKTKVRNGQVLTIKEVLMEYVEKVKPMYEEFILPSKKNADIVIPRGVENQIALKVLTNRIEEYIESLSKSESKSSSFNSTNASTASSSVTASSLLDEAAGNTTAAGAGSNNNTKKDQIHAAGLLAQQVSSSYKNIPK
ncbi:uridine kinase family-domain-containing protein [Mycotypha africana]|uniref:uridine kinase family-domain-containing protein n=1 Tax=Mycotypha africana TaxID=64632 RepID=UPI002301D419|nr:uridine kinase family-domain-containing protein [Mycotypha africana]KAI8975678.1 uridine kinase family-domain-containing protein [Mycotypha africana]